MSGITIDWIFTAQDRQLTIRWDDGVVGSYTALWLRDNCPEDRDPDNGQRLIDIAEQPEEPWIGEVFREGDTAISIIWGDEEKTSVFDVAWLREYAGAKPNTVSPRQQPLLWEAAQVGDLTWMDYDEIIASDAALARWLRALAGYGIAFLHGVPSEPGKVLEVARRIGPVRPTNQGLLFDIRSVPTLNSTNHTTLALAPHTGAPFHEPVPGVKWLHCLQHGVGGGDNLFLDGYAVAACLREHFPDAYNILTWTPVRFLFRSATEELTADWPLIQLDRHGELEAIHYDTRFIAPHRLPHEALAPFYGAYRIFALLLRDSHFIYQIQLSNGDLAAFDNRRILHGQDPSTIGATSSHLQGCYTDMDALLSRLAVLERA